MFSDKGIAEQDLRHLFITSSSSCFFGPSSENQLVNFLLKTPTFHVFKNAKRAFKIFEGADSAK